MRISLCGGEPRGGAGDYRPRHQPRLRPQVGTPFLVGPHDHPPGKQPPGDEEWEEADEGGARKAK